MHPYDELTMLAMELLKSVVFFSVYIAPLLAFFIIRSALRKKAYHEGAYYQITKTPYHGLQSDLGKYGEYLIYKQLKHLEETGGKFLFNLYIPKENEETTEIDVLLICPKGLFVFESKNYSGWIFGNEFQKTWTQTLPQGRDSRKEHFYNPIWQNQAHMKHLKNLLGEHLSMRSVIVFSERCTLKNVNVQSIDIHVINRYDIKDLFSTLCGEDIPDSLTETEIADIYNKLYSYTQVSSEVKTQHIANIEKNLGLSQETVVEQVVEETVIAPIVAEEPVVTEADAPVENTQLLKCPKCGGTLVLRTAKRGPHAGKQFYGCEGYPKCRYVEEVEEEIIFSFHHD